MAASEVNAWGGFVVCLPACPPCAPACARSPSPPLVGDPAGVPLRAGHVCHTQGSAPPSYPRLGTAWEPSPRWKPTSRRVGRALCLSILPAEGLLPPIPWGGSQGDIGEGGGGKGVTGRSNLRM